MVVSASTHILCLVNSAFSTFGFMVVPIPVPSPCVGTVTQLPSARVVVVFVRQGPMPGTTRGAFIQVVLPDEAGYDDLP